MTAALAITGRSAAALAKPKRLIGFGILELLPTVLFLVAAAQAPADDETSIAIIFATSFYFPLIAPIVTMIVAAGALGAERRDNTLSFIVLRPVSRIQIAAAKVAAAVLAATVINAIGAISLGTAYALVNGRTNLIVPLLVGGFIVSACYTAIFVPFGFITNRAVVIGLIFLFVIENGVVVALSGMAWLSPWRIGYSAFVGLLAKPIVDLGAEADEVVDAALGSLAGGAGGALAKTAVLLIVGTLLSAWLLRKRDLA